MAAHNCLAIRLDKIDVVRLDYQLDDTSPNMLSMYQADQDTPVAEYDVTKLTMDQRHELFNKLVAAITNAPVLPPYSKELEFWCR